MKAAQWFVVFLIALSISAGGNAQNTQLGIIGGVQSGIALKYAINVTDGVASADAWPDSLDGAAAGSTCGPNNAFFDYVLAQGGVKDVKWHTCHSVTNRRSVSKSHL